MDAAAAQNGVWHMSIAALERKIRQISDTGKLLSRAREAMAKQAVSLAKEGFAQSKAPSGNRWKPLKVRVGQPLVLTGTLSNFSYKMTSNGFILYAGADYFVHHQYGAPKKKLPARPMVPNSDSWGAWSKPMVAAAEKSIARWMR